MFSSLRLHVPFLERPFASWPLIRGVLGKRDPLASQRTTTPRIWLRSQKCLGQVFFVRQSFGGLGGLVWDHKVNKHDIVLDVREWENRSQLKLHRTSVNKVHKFITLILPLSSHSQILFETNHCILSVRILSCYGSTSIWTAGICWLVAVGVRPWHWPMPRSIMTPSKQWCYIPSSFPARPG